ncbi:unnamed protein product [Ilex paraguariensis]|uniref:SET domain-containing protein n=1 Tax=Ilex paraguariensis TaxID=185542 RepID=A0ABC8SE21_9AQUA
MLLSARNTKPWRSLPPFFALFRCLRRAELKFSTSSSSAKTSLYLHEVYDDFLPWLEQKAGAEISSVLSIGKSAYGRSLYASKPIQTGDCILKVPYSVQLAPENLLPAINYFLGDGVGNVAKLAIVILVEQKLGQDSEWAPYVSRLPQPEEMHSTVFWSHDELEMIRPSFLYQETIKQKAQIEKEFLANRPALRYFSNVLGDVTLKEFRHAYGLVTSRAWHSTQGVSMIPFADFLNHDGISEADVLSDEGKKHSEVIADRNYAPGDQVLIRYGKFSNATLLLDFGFTLPYNIYDQVQVELSIPHHDQLRAMKLELLRRHCTPTIKDVNGFSSSENMFTIKKVRSANGKGRGIPLSLRAFARVLCSTSAAELDDLAMEAAQNDGRLARYPLKNRSREILAHQFLLSRITEFIEKYSACIEVMIHES